MMAHIFEKPVPANPSLIESSFTEIFGEVHFHDGGKAPLDPPPTKLGSDPLQLCTEGLGFESTGDVEDLTKEYSCDEYWSGCRNGAGERRSPDRYSRRRSGGKGKGGGFPPLISTIGRSGKPLVHLESYRNDGRFILKEVRMPTQDFLHASREDGRLKLQLFHPVEGRGGGGGGGEEDV